MEQVFIKITANKKSECGNPFQKGSTFQALVKAGKFNPEWELLPMNAKDLKGRPYDGGVGKLYSMVLKDGEFEVIKQAEMKRVAFSFPGSEIEDDGQSLDLGLEDIHADRGYMIDRDGYVNIKTSGKEEECKEECEEDMEKKEQKKTAESETNMLTDSQENISTDFNSKVEGSDDPSYSEPWTEDTSEKPATFPILGTAMKFEKEVKAKSSQIRKKLGITEPNMQTGSNEDISIDFNTAVDGSGTVSYPYKEDTSNKNAESPILGELSGKKKTAEEKVIKTMPSDGNSGGSNLDDYSIEGNVEEGSKDEFRPKEAEKKTANVNDPNQQMRDFESVDPSFDANMGNMYEEDDNDWLDTSALGLTPEEEAEALKGTEEKPLY